MRALKAADMLGDRDISPRDAEVVRAIEEEGLSVFTFDGLRRITRTHPETLSRTLDRLEEGGLVVRVPEGYSVTDKAKENLTLFTASDPVHTVPILHTFLPYDASAGRIVASLKGRWLDNIRWVGTGETPDGLLMKWVTDDGAAIVDVKLASGQLDIEAKVADDSDLPKAVRAAHQLIGRISRLYSTPRPGSRTAMMQIGYFTPYAM